MQKNDKDQSGISWLMKRQTDPRIVDRALSKSRHSMYANIYISGTACPISWYLKPQTHDRGRDRTERKLQAEEQIFERVEEEPDVSTRRLNHYILLGQ
ncbi:hypothetical protein Zmor_005709 [Zophobas morio]|mgnify:FL=1|uniref:Uncharacterized protein n=1 Tax=Zophobas morio TaxID=2755281 RepID=A0AA38IGC7_9CUCU|nr:hypothetical protein Zmor_014111 [Zophobas morio]KAJ3661310.1 hypothetical protein Zmor_005709 [Zophobas morio]